ncbi:hypothetical protein TRVA0_024S00298 [Trichomonascus vanleenenianus]|uniref:Nhp10p n=1 Tax=Trichomonascus vanleenenianus TaxID=2268995 RepID=UPI003ECB927B
MRSASRRAAVPVLPESEESKYKQKCKDLRKRIREIEESNETMAVSIERTKRAIQRIRLERALMMEKLEEKTILKVDDSDGTPSPPPSPIPNEALKRREMSPSMSVQPASAVGTPSSPGEKKPAKKARDPNLPKRPQNRYRIFCEVEKESLKKKMEETHPGESYDLNKAMAEAWKELTEDERKKYDKLYDEARARYVTEMAQYSSPHPSESEQRERKIAERMQKDLEAKGTPVNVELFKNDKVKEEGEEEDQEEREESVGATEELATNDSTAPLLHEEPHSEDEPMDDIPSSSQPQDDQLASEL